MKKIVALFILVTIAFSCKKEVTKETSPKETVIVKKEHFPETLSKVFTKHVGCRSTTQTVTLKKH